MRLNSESSWFDRLLRKCCRCLGLSRLFGGLDTGKLSNRIAEIEPALAGLSEAVDAVERRFVAIGEAFAEQMMLNGSLRGASDRLLSADDCGGGASDPVDASVKVVLATLDLVDANTATAHALLSRFDQYQQQIQGVKEGRERLARTLVPLQIIERLFRIESAGLPVCMQQAFESLTQEIGQLHRQMRETLARQFDAMAGTEALVDTARQRLAAHASHLKVKVRATRSATDRAMGELETGMQKHRLRSERLASMTEQLESDVSHVVVGLQYQDLMRQKADHVIESARAINSSFAAGRVGDPGFSAAQLERASRLEARQTAAIADGLAQASREIESGIARISDRLERVDQECLPPGELAVAIATDRSVTETLLTSMGDARSLLRLAAEGVEQAYEAAESFGANAANVTSALRRLALDIKLIALNAQVQAAQIGEGTGLEVLSEKTCQLSEETSLHTRAIGQELDELIENLSGVVRACRETKEKWQLESGLLESGLVERERALRTRHDNTVAALRETDSLLRQAAKHTEEMRRCNDFGDVSSQSLRQVEELFDAIAALASVAADSNKDAPRESAMMEMARQRYTMDSERIIFRSVFEEPSETRAPFDPAERESASSSKSNIELF